MQVAVSGLIPITDGIRLHAVAQSVVACLCILYSPTTLASIGHPANWPWHNKVGECNQSQAPS